MNASEQTPIEEMDGYELQAEVHRKDTQIAKLEAVRDQAIANTDKGIELLNLAEEEQNVWKRTAEILSDTHWGRHWSFAEPRLKSAHAQALKELDEERKRKEPSQPFEQSHPEKDKEVIGNG